MIGTRMDVKTLSDMDRINGDESERSFWKVLMDSKRRSEFVDALLSISMPFSLDDDFTHNRKR